MLATSEELGQDKIAAWLPAVVKGAGRITSLPFAPEDATYEWLTAKFNALAKLTQSL